MANGFEFVYATSHSGGEFGRPAYNVSVEGQLAKHPTEHSRVAEPRVPLAQIDGHTAVKQMAGQKTVRSGLHIPTQ